MTSPALKPTHPAPRLVVVSPEGIAVYEGRKMLAFSRDDYQRDAAEVEADRTAAYVAPAEEKKS